MGHSTGRDRRWGRGLSSKLKGKTVPDPRSAARAEAPTPELPKKVTDRPPNPNGTIFIVEYHHYVLPKIFFGPPEKRRDKVKLLLEMGCEIGTHTMSHPRLRRLSDTQVKREIALSIDRLASYAFRRR